MSASVSPFSCLSLIIPFEEFRVLCSETVTGKLKKSSCFEKIFCL